MFVLLVSDDLLDSTWVPKEITVARESGRKTLPVNVAGAIDRLPLDTQPWDAILDRSWVEESEETFCAGAPARHVAEQIDQSYTSTRRRVIAIRGLFAAGFFVSPHYGKVPKLQILTVEGLLGSAALHYPRMNTSTFKRATRQKKTKETQPKLEGLIFER